jgi:thiamine phosphate synthase YjbQ (UPF0047 family)
MKKIKNIDDFHAEKQRLQLEVMEAEAVLKEDLKWVKEELKPENVASTIFRGFLKKNIGGIFNSGTGSIIEFILRDVVLSKSGWIKRLIIPLLAKNVSSGIISENKTDILGILRNLVKKARTYTHENSSHFDKSTVDEMDS